MRQDISQYSNTLCQPGPHTDYFSGKTHRKHDKAVAAADSMHETMLQKYREMSPFSFTADPAPAQAEKLAALVNKFKK